MPKLDGTGPEGKGEKTRRKLGNCTDLPDELKLQKHWVKALPKNVMRMEVKAKGND